jgi:hypothetical protein
MKQYAVTFYDSILLRNVVKIFNAENQEHLQAQIKPFTSSCIRVVDVMEHIDGE